MAVKTSYKNILKSLFRKIKFKLYRPLRLRIKKIKQFDNEYVKWSEIFHDASPKLTKRILLEISKWKEKPLISVIMPVYKIKTEWLEMAIESVRNQIYHNWELCIAEDCSDDPKIVSILKKHSNMDPRIKVVFRSKNGHISAASNSAAQLATSEWIALLDDDDLLHPTALYHVADTINRNPNAEIIYSDEDKIDVNQVRSGPYFKYDFNIDLFYVHNMISHLGVYRAKTFREIGGFREGFEGSQDYDLALRFLDKIDVSQIIHIPRVLYHWRIHDGSAAQKMSNKNYAGKAGEKALNEYFKRSGTLAKAVFEGVQYRTHYMIPKEKIPLVSIIIPTYNYHNLLKVCLKSIYQKTVYSHFEVIIIDNLSDDPKTLTYLKNISKKHSNLRVIKDDTYPFNYSKINNNASIHAKGQYICFLNNDTEVISGQWLSEMVAIARQKQVGIVGARLWYREQKLLWKKKSRKRRLQHGGVVMGIGGIAGHKNKHHRAQCRDPNLQAFAMHCTHSVSAVTGACMVISKKCFTQVGGFDEENAPTVFSDVDLCLRVLEHGYRNVWTPHADLYHEESRTRKNDHETIEKMIAFQNACVYLKKRWKNIIERDPCYNPNLSLLCEGHHVLNYPPRLNMISKNIKMDIK
ncbi:glycosyltransferase family 2 protein [Candidatus Liberibacter brunswickensis]|uniref:glycosyltransferase family 2 protein n=1 Tax=Candidatus Liberibacter brunswickensis TaxID=1968796 RepID=UPI002FE2AFA3